MCSKPKIVNKTSAPVVTSPTDVVKQNNVATDTEGKTKKAQRRGKTGLQINTGGSGIGVNV